MGFWRGRWIYRTHPQTNYLHITVSIVVLKCFCFRRSLVFFPDDIHQHLVFITFRSAERPTHSPFYQHCFLVRALWAQPVFSRLEPAEAWHVWCRDCSLTTAEENGDHNLSHFLWSGTHKLSMKSSFNNINDRHRCVSCLRTSTSLFVAGNNLLMGKRHLATFSL